jgi:hypothetical protein
MGIAQEVAQSALSLWKMVGSLRIQRALQRDFQFLGFESERPGLAFVGYPAISIDHVDPIGPRGVSLFGGVAEFVEHSRDLDAKLAHAGTRNRSAFVFAVWAGENDVVFNIALHLPDVAGMCLGDIDDEEGGLFSVLLVEFVEGGNLPPERRSSVTAEDKHDRLMLRGQGRELNGCALIELGQRKVGSLVTNLQSAGAGVRPQSFKRKDEEGDGSRHPHHETRKNLGRTQHDAIKEATENQPQKGKNAD